MARVLVAMSGGVDSSVAAAMLVEAGHDVTGVHLKLADLPVAEQVPGQGCCTLDDAQDARRVAQVLGIPFYVWDLSDVFRAEVQEPFAATYSAGATPNPCVSCNEKVKYAALLARARGLGFDALATGHHVRLRRGGVAGDGSRVDALPVVDRPGRGTRMFRAADPAKDQTYVLHVATASQLDASLFPVGELTKAEVRRRAERFGLRVASKPDSYDVCFIPDGDTAGYLRRRLPAVRGEIVDLDGTVVGHHEGVWGFTVGQRRGLGLGLHEPRWVVDVDASRNRVVVGPRTAATSSWVEVAGLNLLVDTLPDVAGLQVRAHGRVEPVSLSECEGGVRASFDAPVEGLARGQSAVLYTPDGQELLGGGRIVAAQRPAVVVAS